MSRSMSLCFLAVSVAMILLCAGSTRADDQFTDTAREMVRIYGDPSVSRQTKQQNLPRLANFYEENRDRIQLNPELRQEADQVLTKYKQSFVEGVPPQGGDTYYATGNATIIINKASGAVINRGTAIFGLAFIAACVIFRSKSL